MTGSIMDASTTASPFHATEEYCPCAVACLPLQVMLMNKMNNQATKLGSRNKTGRTVADFHCVAEGDSSSLFLHRHFCTCQVCAQALHLAWLYTANDSYKCSAGVGNSQKVKQSVISEHAMSWVYTYKLLDRLPGILLPWCSWLSRESNTLKVSGSSPDGCMLLLPFAYTETPFLPLFAVICIIISAEPQSESTESNSITCRTQKW